MGVLSDLYDMKQQRDKGKKRDSGGSDIGADMPGPSGDPAPSSDPTESKKRRDARQNAKSGRGVLGRLMGMRGGSGR